MIRPSPVIAKRNDSTAVRRNDLKRDIAIDYLRSGVTLLVVAHHASLAYNTVSYYDADPYMKSLTPVVAASFIVRL